MSGRIAFHLDSLIPFPSASPGAHLLRDTTRVCTAETKEDEVDKERANHRLGLGLNATLGPFLISAKSMQSGEFTHEACAKTPNRGNEVKGNLLFFQATAWDCSETERT